MKFTCRKNTSASLNLIGWKSLVEFVRTSGSCHVYCSNQCRILHVTFLYIGLRPRAIMVAQRPIPRPYHYKQSLTYKYFLKATLRTSKLQSMCTRASQIIARQSVIIHETWLLKSQVKEEGNSHLHEDSQTPLLLLHT